MKATHLLEAQHKAIEHLFKQLERSDDDRKTATLFRELASTLEAHDTVEREIFYPACRRLLGPVRVLGKAMAEHDLIEYLLCRAHEAVGALDFAFRRSVLDEVVSHHIIEEEDDLFARARFAFGAEGEQDIGLAIGARYSQIKNTDYRTGLFAYVRKMFEGGRRSDSGEISTRDVAEARASAARAGRRR